MLRTILVILLVLWLLGMVSSYTMGGSLHVLLAVAAVMLIVDFLSRRRTI
jgi:asparagine N-glycosylation enzyme membrane subunit Stt3